MGKRCSNNGVCLALLLVPVLPAMAQDDVLAVSGLKIEPTEATVGQTATIIATVTNTMVGMAWGTIVRELIINDQIVDSRKIYQWAGNNPMPADSTVVEFTFIPSEEDTNTIAIGNQEATLIIEPEPVVEPEPVAGPDEETSLNMWLIIGSILGVLLAGGMIWYLVIRRR